MSLRGSLKVLEKTKKSAKIFPFQYKKKLETIETISYTTKFIDSARFMASSS